jgi:hypothetical protein
MSGCIQNVVGKDRAEYTYPACARLLVQIEPVFVVHNLRWIDVDDPATLSEARHKLLWPLPDVVPSHMA